LTVKLKLDVKLMRQSLALILSYFLMLTTATGVFAQADQSAQPATQSAEPLDQSSAQPPVQSGAQPAVQAAPQTAAQLQQLVAPIALYPDALVAQILAASTYPDQVVEADRWLQQHPDLRGEDLGKEVDKQPWDPSVKALTEFPSVLANMDKNLSWTSSLGDAYVNQEQDVMNAVQVMRQDAQKAGNLNSTSQEKVSNHSDTIVIEPADPQVVYVPEYDPWLVYGAPIGVWPGWYSYPGLYIAGPGIGFGLGFGIGFFGGFGWGFHHWGSDWHHHDVLFDHHGFVSHSRVFVNRDHFGRGGGFRGEEGIHGGNAFHGGGFVGGHDFHGPAAPRPGIAAPHGQPGGHSGAFGGFNHGGVAGGFSSRGQSSFGGGSHGGGGGGFHGGGGGHGGGGHR
jgi:hypothetical protein